MFLFCFVFVFLLPIYLFFSIPFLSSLELSRHLGSEPALLGLISAYKAYAPELIILSIPPTRASLFKHPDPNWERNFQRIQSRQPPALLPPVAAKGPRGRRPQAGGKAPTLLTTLTSKDHLSVQDLTSLEDLAQNVDRLEFPNQLAAVLDNRMLQHLLSCQAESTVHFLFFFFLLSIFLKCFVLSESTILRLGHWVSQTLLELCFRSDQSTEVKRQITQLLDQAIAFSRFMQEELPTMETFLITFLRTWNGVDFADQIFALLSMMRPLRFDEFCTFCLKPLQRLFFSSSVSWKVRLISSFSALLRNWASVDWKRFYSSDSFREFVFEKPSTEANHYRTIRDFIQVVDSICVVALQAENDHTLLQHAVLSFFEVVVDLHLLYDTPFVVLPSTPIVYRCCVSDTGVATSRLGGVITKYKAAFSKLKKVAGTNVIVDLPGHSSTSFSNGLENIETFNHYIYDVTSLIWKTKPLLENIRLFPLPP